MKRSDSWEHCCIQGTTDYRTCRLSAYRIGRYAIANKHLISVNLPISLYWPITTFIGILGQYRQIICKISQILFILYAKYFGRYKHISADKSWCWPIKCLSADNFSIGRLSVSADIGNSKAADNRYRPICKNTSIGRTLISIDLPFEFSFECFLCCVILKSI